MTIWGDTGNFQRQLMQTPSPGPEAGFAESFEAARQRFADETSAALQAGMIEQTQRLNDKLEERGVKPPRAPVPGGMAGPAREFDKQLARYLDEVQKLAKDNDLSDLDTSEGAMLDNIRRDFQQTEDEFQNTMRRAGFTGQAGAFLGGIAGASQDPLVLASMVLGAPASAGIARTAAIEAGIAGASEIPIQAAVQAQRERLDMEHGFNRALRNIGLAAAGGGILGAGGKAAARGLQRGGGKVAQAARRVREERPDLVQRSRAINGATSLLSRYDSTVRRNPMDDVDQGDQQFRERMSEDLDAARRGTDRQIEGEIPAAPLRKQAFDNTQRGGVEDLPQRAQTGNLRQGMEVGEAVRSQVLSNQRIRDGQQAAARNAITEQLAEVDKDELARSLKSIESVRDQARKAQRFRKEEQDARQLGFEKRAKGKASAATKAEKAVQEALRQEGLEPSQRDVRLIAENQDEYARFRDVLAEENVTTKTLGNTPTDELASLMRQYVDQQQTRRQQVESAANATAQSATSARREMQLAERAEDQEEQLVEDALNDARARIEEADEDEAVADLQRGVEEAEEEDRFVREVEDCLRRTSE